MKKSTAFLLFFLLTAAGAAAQPGFGDRIVINEGWRFRLDAQGDHSSPAADDQSWRTLDLPHDWSIEGRMSPDLASCTGYLPGGVGWYRKHISIAKEQAGRKQFIYFDGVYCHSEVWINGHSLGRRPNGYISFMYELTPYIRYGADNVIAVRVDHSRSADSRWYTGSGIFRDVFLVSSDPIHIDQWGVFARSQNVTSLGAQVVVDTWIRNESSAGATVSVESALSPKGGKSRVASSSSELSAGASGTARIRQTLQVDNPALWEPDSPALYELLTVVRSAGRVIDRSVTTVGIRDVRFSADEGLALNGKNMKVKGVCLHHDAGALGAAVPVEVWRERLLTLKSLGCNSVRTSHNPQAYQLYDLCDELGLLVMDEAYDEWEFPKIKWLKGWTLGEEKGYQGSYEFFEQWSDRDIDDFVRRDRNHPSVFLWSIGNEVDYPNDPYSHPVLDTARFHQKTIVGYKKDKPNAERIGAIARRLYDDVKAQDSSRCVTGALAGVIMSNHTDYPHVVDVVGYNYTEDRYDLDHRLYPGRVIYGSENRHEYEFWRAVVDNPHIFGQYLWTGIDYLGEAGKYPSRGFEAGLIDLAGNVKVNGFYRQSLWSDTPMIYAATIPVANAKNNTRLFQLPNSTWNYPTPGQMIRVACFTNCEKAEIEVNGRKIATEPRRDKNSNALLWDVPYEKGSVRVTGYNRGAQVARYELKTFAEASSLAVHTADRNIGGAGEVAIVRLEVLDRAGLDVLDYNQPVKCTVSGTGRLAAMENGNMSDVREFTSDVITPFNGRLTAYVKASGAGKITVRFTSGKLSAETTLTAKR